MSRLPLRILFAFLALGLPMAHAAPVFPGASGVGLEPPPGMTPAKTFNGFQGGQASIVITEMPKEAYGQINSSRDMFISRFGAKQADDVDVGGVHGFLIKGMQTVGAQQFRKWIAVLDGADETALVSAQVPADDTAISDGQIDKALHSVVFRPRPGLDQQIAALPFTVGDLAGFRISASALGAALILVDGPKDTDPNQSQAHIVVAANGGAPTKGDHAAFAKDQMQRFQAVHTTDVKSVKTFDANGAQWAEVEGNGSEGQQGTPVAVTYFVRFGTDDFVSIICVAPQAEASRYADRFKTVALSVKPKA